MTLHWNASQVVGGIDQPRFLLVGPELSPNISFEEGLTGVTGGPSGTPQTRVFDSSTPFQDYSLRVEDDQAGSQQYAEITIDTGAAIANKRFIVFSYARNDADSGDQFMWCVFQGLSGTHEKQYTVDENWSRIIVHEVVVPSGAAGNNLVYRIYPFGKVEGNAGVGAVRIDGFHCRQILAEYELPIPDRNKQKEFFREITQAKHELRDGSLKTYKLGRRYYYESGYDKLSSINEFVRTQLANTEYEMVFFPHKDAANCYLVKWADDLERRWAYGTAALGHEADVQLIGQEVIPFAPDNIVDAGTLYEYEEDILGG